MAALEAAIQSPERWCLLPCRSLKLAAFVAQIGPLDRFDRLRRSLLKDGRVVKFTLGPRFARSRGPIHGEEGYSIFRK